MKNIAGWLTLGTDLDTSKFDKKLEQLENKLSNEEIDLDIINIDYESEKRKLEDLNRELERQKKNQKDISEQIDKQKQIMKEHSREENGVTKISKDDLETYNKAKDELFYLYGKLEQTYEPVHNLQEEWEKQNIVVEKLQGKIEKQKNKIGETREEIVRTNNEVKKGQLLNMKQVMEGIGKETTKVVNKVKNWALALIGIRGIYGFIRQSMSTLAQHDKQLAADLQYIKYALASTLEPIIKKIVEWIYLLLQYLGYIIKAWTGRNIFENANKALKESNKQAKELQKTMASFDEMNVLGKQSEAQTNPSVDLTNLIGDEDAPGWVKWIAKNGKTLLAVAAGIAGAIIAAKLGLEGIKALGIGIAVAGLVYMIESIIDYLEEPTWDNFGDILIGYALLIGGVAIAFGAWPVALAAAVLLMVGILIKFWDKIEKFFDGILEDVYAFGDNAMEFLTNKLGIFGTILGGFVNLITGGIAEMIRMIRDRLQGLFTGIKGIFDGIIQIFKGDFKNGIVTIMKGIANIVIGVINTIIDGINLIITPFRAIVYVGAKVLGWDVSMEDIRIPNIPRFEISNGVAAGIAESAAAESAGVNIGSGYNLNWGSAGLDMSDLSYQNIGQEISKYIQVQTTNYINMNGRTISKEIKKIQNENDFAYNI